MKCRSCFNALEQCCVVLGCKKISALERWTVRREQKPDRVEWWTNCDGLSPHLWRLFWFFVSRKWAFQLHLQSFAISDKGCHSVFYCHTVRPLVAFNLLQTEIAIFGGLFCGGSQQIIWLTEHIEGPASVQGFLSVPEQFKRTCPCKELKIEDVHNRCRNFRVLTIITALEKIVSVYLGLWDYQLRVARVKNVTGSRDMMESALGMDSAAEEPSDAMKLKV